MTEHDDTAEDSEELPTIHAGDYVVDRDGDPRDDATVMLVVSLPGLDADEHEFGDGTTVAEANPDYPACDAVVSVAFPQRGTSSLTDLRRYAYPRSRLQVVASTHEKALDGDAVDEVA